MPSWNWDFYYLPGPERNKMSIISWRRNGYRSRTSHIRMTKLIRQALQLIRVEVVVIPQNVIMWWTTRTLRELNYRKLISSTMRVKAKVDTHLNTLMTAQIEVELGWMCNANIDCCTRWNISRFAALFFLVSTEQTCMMSLLHYDECDSWTIVGFQLDASLANRSQFMLQDVRELSFGYAIAIQNNSVRFVATCRFVEHHQQFAHHTAQLLDHLLAVLLNSHGGGITRWMSIHRTNNRSNRRFFVVTCWWVCDISTKENHRLVENLRANRWNQNWVDSAELDVDFQAQVRERLWRCFVDVFGLNALCRHSEHCIAYALYFSYNEMNNFSFIEKE